MVNATAASMASIAAVGGPYVAAALEARGGNLLQLTALSAVYLAGLLVGPVVVERHARGRGLYFGLIRDSGGSEVATTRRSGRARRCESSRSSDSRRLAS